VQSGAQAIILVGLTAAYAHQVDDAIRYSPIHGMPWNLELKEVHRRSKLFEGTEDIRTKLTFGRHCQKHPPNAELVRCENIIRRCTSMTGRICLVLSKLGPPDSMSQNKRSAMMRY